MLYGLYLSAAGVLTCQHRMEVISNNLANVQTPAFKPDVALFKQRLAELYEDGLSRRYAAPVADGTGGGLFVAPTRSKFTPAPLEQTNRDLDIGISGSGFFVVGGQDGRHFYTRDGRMRINQRGELVMQFADRPFLSVDGEPIVVSPTAKLRIAADGSVYQNGSKVATLAMVDFADRTGLAKAGSGLFENRGGQRPRPASGRIHQGFLEDSATQPTTELVEMIQASRQLEANAMMIRYQDSTLAMAVGQLARLTG